MSREGMLKKPLLPIERWMYGVLLSVLAVLFVSISIGVVGRWAQREWSSIDYPADLSIDTEKTEQYLRILRIEQFELNGTDYTNEKYSPVRLNIPLKKINDLKDYDFQRTEKLRETLRGVNRKVVLQRIFSEVTKGLHSNTKKHIAILKFLHKSSFHNTFLQPIEQTGRSVEDPLLLLHLGEMRCSHVARVAIDLFESSGYRGRVVQLGGHQIAEIFYDRDWHYFDGDIFGNGETIIDENGDIPSVVELSKDPFAIDVLGHYRELQYGGKLKVTSTFYPSYPYFGKDRYGLYREKGLFYEKTASESEEQNYRFGWDFYETSVDDSRILHEMASLYQPGAVIVTSIQVERNDQKVTVSLKWEKARDRDDDILGYKVFVSHQSRGWEYVGDLGIPTQGREYVFRTGGWRPSMYEKMYDVPLHEVALVSTEHLFADITLPVGEEYFFTVMPFDAHGEEVGKQLYLLSHEFHVDLRETTI